MRLSANVVVAIPFLLLSAVQAMAAPSVQILGVTRIQPGWVRIYLKASGAPNNAIYQLSFACAAPTDARSISSVSTAGSVLGFDIKVNPGWLADNSLPQPCRISHLDVAMKVDSLVFAEALQDVDVPMDLPLSLMTPANTTVTPTLTSVSLAPPRTFAAYPPIFVAIQSATRQLGFAEVEELTARGTVGLRGLSVFSGSYLVSELGGGAEMPPGWGLDINGLGIWRAPQLAVETTNTGHDTFPYSGSTEPPLLSDPTMLHVFPAPPLYTETDYETYVLNNRGARRCNAPTGCMDATYDTSNASNHILAAINGAKLALITPGSIVLGAQTNLSGPVVHAIHPAAPAPLKPRSVEALPRTSAVVIPNIEPAVSQRLLATARQLSRSRAKTFRAALQMPTALSSSSAPMQSNAITRDRSLVPESPQEAIVPHQTLGSNGVLISNSPTASCVINPAQNGVTLTPSACNGMGAAGFACPTLSSPIAVEQITGTSDQAGALTATIPPYYAGRDNIYGTCGSHSVTQYVEALYDRYTDDLGIKRVIYVDGDAIVVPEPRVALSVTGSTVVWASVDGTHSNAAPLAASAMGGGPPSMPAVPYAYWPAREADWATWASTAGQEATPKCDSNPSNWWHTFDNDLFCGGQGQAGVGFYRTHSIMVQTLNNSPLSDPPWSMANSYFNTITGSISLSDGDAAIQSVLAEIRLGLPVQLGFNYEPLKSTPDGSGGTLTYFTGLTWYIPAELGACSTAALNAVFAPGNGHSVNIIGYWISGTSASPNPFNSYFIIENNWGKTAGYHSFFFMNFAAFKYLATSLTTYRLDRTCWSVACATQPRYVFPQPLLQRMLYPPDPHSRDAAAFSKLVNDVQAQLAGVGGTSGRRRQYPPPARPDPALK